MAAHKAWTAEDDAILEALLPFPVQRSMDALGRSRASVLSRRHQRWGGTTKSADWIKAHPERIPVYRERENQRRREQWRTREETEKAEAIAKNRAADERVQQATLKRAAQKGRPWTADEDRIVLEEMALPARETALRLKRTLHAIRTRRSLLRKQDATLNPSPVDRG